MPNLMPKTPMEAAFSLIIKEFCKYREQKQGTCMLTEEEFIKLMCEQLPHFVKDKKNPQATCPDTAKKLWDERNSPAVKSYPAEMIQPPEKTFTLKEFTSIALHLSLQLEHL
ncbi:hypothetical protein lerEdw1_020777 [Lerista edwardsae]|nr:hypothetical protein lerEdw1_020777 [Lerista edwardsae]